MPFHNPHPDPIPDMQAARDYPHRPWWSPAGITMLLIRGYQRFISPLAPPSCIYYPTCSEYTYEAIWKYGALRGIWLGARRILRCHPFARGGVDHVP